MAATIRTLSPREFSMLAPTLVEIYIEAMHYSPHINNDRIDVWRRETLRPGFRAIIAELDGHIVGVAYGFNGTPDTWWDRQLRRAFDLNGGITEENWALLHNYFEVAEVHVRESAQGHGIGRRMMNELLTGVQTRYALLSTPEVPGEANPAFGLYRSLGFWDVLRDYVYPGDSRKFAILGVELPLSGA